METSPVLNGVLVGWFLALWVCARLIDVGVPMTSNSASRLGNAGPYCPYSGDANDQWREGPYVHNSVEGDHRAAFVLREKIGAVLTSSRDIRAIVHWFVQQIRMDHLIADVLSCEHVWLTIFGVSVAGAVAHLLMFDPFITMESAPAEYLAEMKRAETTYIQEVMRQSSFVYESTSRLFFEWTYRVTDAAIFAIWFTLVWSVSSLTISANQRFEMIAKFISKTLDEDEATKKLSTPSKQEQIDNEQAEENPNGVQLLMKRLILVLMACFLTATAMTSFGLTSFKAMHILYALIFTVEGLEVLLRSAYVTYRVAWWQLVAYAALGNSEAFRKRAYGARRIADVLFDSLSVVQYVLYLSVDDPFSCSLNQCLKNLIFFAYEVRFAEIFS
uniref:Ion_trans domain-containing protein n=1 Tax=Angiostrongylus cantonensis TaxID=6313 RepID=A0A0K0D3U5_ANGCA